MIANLPKRLTLVWLVLVVATLLGVFIRGETLQNQAVLAAVLAVTMVKVWLVLTEFMELRMAPLGLRLVFHTWIVVVWTGLVGMPFLVDRLGPMG